MCCISGRESLWLRNVASASDTQIVAPAATQYADLTFSPDGKTLTYQIREKGVDNLWIQPLNGSRGRQLTHFTGEQIKEFHWLPDGKTLAVLRGHINSDVVLMRVLQP